LLQPPVSSSPLFVFCRDPPCAAAAPTNTDDLQHWSREHTFQFGVCQLFLVFARLLVDASVAGRQSRSITILFGTFVMQLKNQSNQFRSLALVHRFAFLRLAGEPGGLPVCAGELCRFVGSLSWFRPDT
jgi:hypothetical protein